MALTLEEFLPKARQLNPDYSDDEHIQAYEQRYGRSKPMQTVSATPLTTFDEFLPKARALNPEYSDEEHYAAWQEKYGARGAKEKDQGDFVRGGVTAFKQIPQTVRGLEAGAGAIGEKVAGEGGLFTALKEHGLKGYQEYSADIAKDSKPSDSVTEAYKMAKAGDPGALVDWLQYALGYGGGQALQAVATAGIGYAGGKMALQPAAQAVAGRLIAKESARLAATGMAGEQLAKQAVSNVAARIGQTAALAAVAVGQEGGEIYGGLVEKAAEEDRSLTGKELAIATGATLGAGALEFLGDKIGLDLAFGKSLASKLVSTRLGHAAAAGSLGVATEGGTEFTQTLVEEFGKGNDPFSPGSLRQAVDAAALGGVGGGAVGTVGGLIRRPEGKADEPVVTERTPDEMGMGQPVHPEGGQPREPFQIEGPPQPGEVRGGKVYAPGEVMDVSPLPDVSPVLEAGSLDEAIANAVGVVQVATATAKARAAEFARMTAKAKNETDALLEKAPEKRPAFNVPTLPGPEAQPLTLLHQPSPIVPGQAFTPRPEPIDDPRARLAEERARMVAERERRRLEGQMNPVSEPVAPAQAVEPADEGPLPSQIDLAYPSSKQVRDLIHEKGFHLDTPVFREYLKQAVGKEKFADLTPQELQTLAEKVQKIKAPQQPVPIQEAPPQVPLTPREEKPYAPVTTIPEAQVPRSELTPEKNAEILLRAEKAKADLEIAGQETGRRKVFTDNANEPGQTVTGLASAAPEWYTELQSGPGKVSAEYKTVNGKKIQTKTAREKIEEAIQKIIKDQGADRGKAVEQVKAALLQDQEFHRTEWGRDLASILDGQWPEWVEKPQGVTQATENAKEFQNVERGTSQVTVEGPKKVAKVPPSRTERLKQQKQKMEAKKPEPSPSEAPVMESQPATAQPEREPDQPTTEAAPKTQEPEGEPFSLTAPEPSKAKAKEAGPEQLSIDVPPPTSGERPIIGREATLEEAPLFSKNAQTPDAEQTTLDTPTAQKEPWEMTALEYTRSRLPESMKGQVTTAQRTYAAQHRKEIQGAMDRGETIPPEVLADYPELQQSEPVENTEDTSVIPKQDSGSFGVSSDDLAPNDTVEWKSPFSGTVTEASYRGELNGKAMLWTGRTQVQAEYKDLRKVEPAQSPEPSPSPTDILAAALRTAADQIEGKKKEPKPKEGNLTDVGEELWYNKRNRAGRGISWNDVKDLNATLKVKEVTKARVWPRPDYEQLVADGMHPFTAHLVKQIYDSIATAPSTNSPTDDKMQIYIDTVQKLRESVFSWAKNLQQQRELLDKMAGQASAERSAQTFGSPVQISSLMKSTDYSIIRQVWPSPEGVGAFRDQKNKESLFLVGGNKLVGALQPGYDEAKRAVNALKEGWPAQQEAWQKRFSIKEVPVGEKVYSRDGTRTLTEPEFWIMRKSKASRFGNIVETGLNTRDEAVEKAKSLAERKEKDTDEEEMPLNLEGLQRVGIERREKGKNISPSEFKDTFGFRGVNFGNWTNQVERQAHVNLAYDAFMDLADILGIPPKALSLDGLLGVAFGAQGSGKYAAHFVPGVNEINLTKTRGAGALAHEWAHAVDHYFAVQAGERYAKSTDPFLTHLSDVGSSTIRPEVVDAFKAIVKTMKQKDQTAEEIKQGYSEKLARAEKGLRSWTDVIEKRVPEEKRGPVSKLIERIKMGDVGDGYVKGAGKNSAFLPRIHELREAYKTATGTLLPKGEAQAIQNWTSSLKYARNSQTPQGHIPQKSTNYSINAEKLDKDKGGKVYWTQPTELFARAFQSYVMDRLNDKAERNDYLTRPQKEGSVSYPQGEERAVINGAFDKLVNTLQTKETDKGTALYEPSPAYQSEAIAEDLTPGQQALENTPYHVREGEQQALNFDMASEAIGTLDRTEGVSTTGRDVYGPRIPAKTVALGISPDLIRHGVVDLTGYHVSSPEDVAKLAQVYRDPRFETFRVFYLKDGNIVGHEGITSRLPGLVKLFKSQEDADQRMQAMRTRMDTIGADGYYLLHNHPSGESKPSAHDVALTERFAKTLPGFQGHVVIDSSEYSTLLLNRDGRVNTQTHTLDLGEDALLKPSIDHPLLDVVIASPQDVVSIGQAIKPEAGYATVIYTSGRGGRVRSIQEVSIAYLSDQAQATTYLNEQAVAFGGQSIYVSTGPGASRQFVAAMDRMIEQGVVRDYVSSHDGRSAYSRLDAGVSRHPDFTMGTHVNDIPSEQVGESTAKYSRQTGTIDPPIARERLKESKASLRPYLLGALGLEQLSQVYGKDHAEVKAYNKATQDMEADFTEMSRESDVVARAWTDLKIPVADKMAQVMEDARFLNFDPDPRKKQEADSAKKQELVTRFDQLPEDAKAVYRQARDFYTNMAEQRFQALKERIERAGGTPENTRKLVDRLQLAYEQVRSKVYFPFTRFGENIVVAKQMKDGKEVDREVHAFESVAEAQKFATMMKLKGWQVKQTVAREYSVDKEGPASKIVRQMHDIIKELGQGQQGLPGVMNLEDQLLDSLNQSFLQALPDMSYAKHFIHAKDVKGASRDALRSFAHSALHGAHHISRIRHADKVTQALMKLDDKINETAEGDTTEARQVYNELVQRHNDIMNPNTHPFSAWLGQLGFTMSLGGVVATGITNATQVPLVTYPWLGARYGFGKASAALARAYKDFLNPRTLNKDSLFDASKSKLISESERKMLLELARRGRIDLTQTMDLAGLSSQDNLSRKARLTGTLNEKVTRMLGFTFHAPEVMNRQVTALSTFRLEKEKGGSFDEALQRAEQAIIDTHFLYQSFNRPRYMSGNFLRVLTMFRQYSQNIAYTYGRAASIWLDKNNATKEERTVAKRQLISMLALQFGAAGALGMPFFGSGVDILMAVVGAFGDDDDKREWEVALRKWLDGTATSLAEAFIDDKEQAAKVGKELAEVVSHGASRLTPWDMAGRLGQNDLFFREPQREREGRQAVMDWMMAIGGPVPSYGVNFMLGMGDVAKGITELNAGFFMRGVEELTPAVLRNGVKSLRYTLEGVRTRDEYKQLELDTSEKLGQAFGFTPKRVAEMYESTTAVKNKEHRILNEQKSLKNRFARAVDDQDDAAKQRILEDIRGFNERNRMFAITSDTLNRSLKARRQHEAGMERGLYLPPRRRALMDEGDFGDF